MGQGAALRDALPSGSRVALTHPTQDFGPEAVRRVEESARQGGTTLVPRTREEAARFFDGWELRSDPAEAGSTRRSRRTGRSRSRGRAAERPAAP